MEGTKTTADYVICLQMFFANYINFMVKNNFIIEEVKFGQYNHSHTYTYIQKNINFVNSSVETKLSSDYPKTIQKTHIPHN